MIDNGDGTVTDSRTGLIVGAVNCNYRCRMECTFGERIAGCGCGCHAVVDSAEIVQLRAHLISREHTLRIVDTENAWLRAQLAEEAIVIAALQNEVRRLRQVLRDTRTHLAGIRAAGVIETDRLCVRAGLGPWITLTARLALAGILGTPEDGRNPGD